MSVKVTHTIELDEGPIQARGLESWQQRIEDECGIKPVSWNEVFIFIAMEFSCAGDYSKHVIDHHTVVTDIL